MGRSIWQQKTILKQMKKILIVDNQLIRRKSLKEGLMRHGYQVEVAENGLKGMAKMNQFCPDCLVTAIVMPEMDGLELIIAIRKQRNKIPIVATSTRERFGHCDYLDTVKHFGANEVLINPFEIDELLAVLLKYCNKDLLYES